MNAVVELLVNRGVLQIDSISRGNLTITDVSTGTLVPIPCDGAEMMQAGIISATTFRLVEGKASGRDLPLQENGQQ